MVPLKGFATAKLLTSTLCIFVRQTSTVTKRTCATFWNKCRHFSGLSLVMACSTHFPHNIWAQSSQFPSYNKSSVLPLHAFVLTAVYTESFLSGQSVWRLLCIWWLEIVIHGVTILGRLVFASVSLAHIRKMTRCELQPLLCWRVLTLHSAILPFGS